jgi:hypothetical protein
LSKSTVPYVVRWRNGVMDDPNPVLTCRGLVAAMALTRFADVKTGRNCYPGAQKCAALMRVSKDTVVRGWDELKEAGWLEIMPLRASRRRTEGALKVLRWPKRAGTTWPLTAAMTLTAPHMAADSHPTIPGNQEPSGPSGPSGVESDGDKLEGDNVDADKLERWKAARRASLDLPEPAAEGEPRCIVCGARTEPFHSVCAGGHSDNAIERALEREWT